MDSRERHELKQSELAEFVTHFWPWCKKHGPNTLLVILIFVSIYVGVQWYRTRHVRALTEAWSAYNIAVADRQAKSLERVARDYEDMPALRSMALLNAADMLLGQVVFGRRDTEEQNADESVSRRSDLERAGLLYKQVIDGGEPVLMVLNAHFGLAAVQETVGEFGLAQEQYAAAAKFARQSGYEAVAERAEFAATGVDRLSRPVVLAPSRQLGELTPAGPPAPAPTTQPASAPASQPDAEPDAEASTEPAAPTE